MNKEEAENILNDVRRIYRKGYGSSDKRYNTDSPLLHPDKIPKMRVRNLNRLFAKIYIIHGTGKLLEIMKQSKEYDPPQVQREPFAGDAPQMSFYAAKEAANRKHKAYCLHIVGVHTCCVVDYELDESSNPPNVFKMEQSAIENGQKGAWIIDPWMNIACPFGEYKRQVRIRLTRWGVRRKEIQHNSEWLYPNSFFPLLDVAPLNFEEVFPTG